MDIDDIKQVLKHFIVITLLNIYLLDIFYYRMIYYYADEYSHTRLIIWGVIAFVEQCILWKSDISLNSGEGFWKFCFKFLNPVVWVIVCCIYGA